MPKLFDSRLVVALAFVVPNLAMAQPASSVPPAAPTTVAPVGGCENLAAAGAWENITPAGQFSGTAVNGTVAAAIIVDPFDPKRLWLGTGNQNSEIWRSDNCGATWTRVNLGRGSVGDRRTYGGVGDGIQWSMQADFVNQGVIYATSGYGAEGVWKTTDGGYSWRDVVAGTDFDRYVVYRFANNISMDPTDHLHLIVTSHGECRAPYQPSCIAETKDGGKTWKLLAAPEGWNEGGGLIIVKGSHWLWCGTKMMVTKDSGKTWDANELYPACEAEYTTRPFSPASNGQYYVGSRNGVLRSANGETWERVNGTNGSLVAVAYGSKSVFAADQWQPTIKRASLDKDESWSDLPAPPQLSQGTEGGIPFLAYDDTHGILYASMWSGGVARMVIR
jgi:photosystem II stability/assembly factor-like uncharacterized protein